MTVAGELLLCPYRARPGNPYGEYRMNGFLVSAWGGDIKAVRLFSEWAEAVAYIRELESHYKLDEVGTWRGN